MKKVAFPKKTVTIDAGNDLGIEGYEGVKFQMWDDPSRSVIVHVVQALQSGDDTIDDQMAEDFFSAVSQIVVDTNIEGIDFSTRESSMKSFDHETLPWGFMFNVVVSYVVKLINESDSLKKAFGLSSEVETSGNSKNETE